MYVNHARKGGIPERDLHPRWQKVQNGHYRAHERRRCSTTIVQGWTGYGMRRLPVLHAYVPPHYSFLSHEVFSPFVEQDVRKHVPYANAYT
jgi:hypothetical protein